MTCTEPRPSPLSRAQLRAPMRWYARVHSRWHSQAHPRVRTSARERRRSGPGLATRGAAPAETHVLQTTPPRPHRVPLLAARALACRRGARLLFEGLDLDLHAGDLVWVRGRNGRGKTSLLRLVAGIAAPQHGELRLDGAPFTAAPDRSRRITCIGHADALHGDLTAREALTFLLRLHGRARDGARVDAALDHWGVYAHRHAPVRSLSQGQRKRVALARLACEHPGALGDDRGASLGIGREASRGEIREASRGDDREASLWVLDEPFDALDAGGVACLNALLAQHLQRGGSVLLTGHQAALAPTLRWRELDLDARAD